MKKIHTKLLSALFIALVWNSFGQSPVWSYLSQINSNVASIPLIFEGQVTSVEVFAGDDNGNKLPNSSVVWSGNIGYFYDSNGNEAKGYSLATIHICKVYKGADRIKGGSDIKVLTKSFTLDNVFLERKGTGADADTSIHFLNTPPTHDDDNQFDFILPHVSYPKKIYFAKRLDPIVNGNYSGKHFYSNFNKVYEMPFNVPVDIPQTDGTYKRTDAYCALFPLVFETPADLHTFLSQINGIDANATDYCKDNQQFKLIPKQEYITPKVVTDLIKAKAAYERFIEFAKQKRQTFQSTATVAKTSSIDDMTLNIQNERLVSIGVDKWFEFDVYVSANSSTRYFDVASMNIQYNTSVFGSSVFSGGNVVVTPATAFNTTSYDAPVVSDIATNILGIGIGPNTTNSSLSRVQLNGTPQLLLTIRIKIQTCGQAVNVSFTNQSSSAAMCSFAVTPNQNPLLTPFWNNVIYNGNITDNACQPIITNWTNNVPAGRHQNVAITGKYFGNVKGAGSVILKNSDKGDRYPEMAGTNSGGIQAFDLVVWTDNQIIFTLPNVIDSAYYINGTVGGNPVIVGPKPIYPGTGKFKVKNFAGGVAESNAPIVIPYSIKQWIDGLTQQTYTKAYAKLIGFSNNGYRIYVNNRVTTAFANATSTIRRGMKDWTCATGINWFMGPSTNVPYQTDTMCVIDTANISALMQTETNVRSCNVNGVTKYFMRSFDIKIRQSVSPYVWSLDTINNVSNGDYDFFSAISHELGHGHQLGHINDSIIDLMWWQALPYGATYATRKLVRGSPEARTGGEFVTDSLLGNYTNCVPVMTLTYTGNCEGFDTKVKYLGANLFKVGVYPNPSSVGENITLDFVLQSDKEVSVNVYDITGKCIQSNHLGRVKDVQYPLKTADLEKGVYLLQIDAGGQRQAFKLIRQ